MDCKCEMLTLQDRILLLVSREAMPKTISAVISEGANCCAAYADGYSAIHLSAWFGHLQNIKILIKKGTYVNSVILNEIEENSGATALMIAAQRGFKDIVKYLLIKGADMNMKAKNGDTALSLAEEHGHVDVIIILQKHKKRK